MSVAPIEVLVRISVPPVQVLPLLEAAGFRLVGTSVDQTLLTGWVDADKMDSLKQVAGVVSVMPSRKDGRNGD